MNYVRSLTERYGAEIHVLYVITDLAHHRGLYGNFEQDHIDKIIAWENKRANKRLDSLGIEIGQLRDTIARMYRHVQGD